MSDEQKKIYQVQVTRRMTATFYVLADDYEDAWNDAEELPIQNEEFGDDMDDDMYVDEVEPGWVEPGRWLWTGGPDGELINNAREYLMSRGE